MEDNSYYVYRHIRLDSNTPFYIGKGKGNRAYEKKRNKYWHRITNKAGYEVEIFLENLTEQQAFNKEKEFIKLYRDCGYKLANLTDGGEGTSGRVHLESTKLKMSLASKGKKKSPEHAEKLRKLQLGRIPPNKGKKHTNESIEKMILAKSNMTDSTRQKMSEAVRKRIKDISYISPFCKPIIGTDGSTFSSITEADRILGLPRCMLNRAIKNGKPIKGVVYTYL